MKEGARGVGVEGKSGWGGGGGGGGGLDEHDKDDTSLPRSRAARTWVG